MISLLILEIGFQLSLLLSSSNFDFKKIWPTCCDSIDDFHFSDGRRMKKSKISQRIQEIAQNPRTFLITFARIHPSHSVVHKSVTVKNAITWYSIRNHTAITLSDLANSHSFSFLLPLLLLSKELLICIPAKRSRDPRKKGYWLLAIGHWRRHKLRSATNIAS